jgi:hypothetical protein
MRLPSNVALPPATPDHSWHGGTKRRPKLCTAWKAGLGAVCDKPRGHADAHHGMVAMGGGAAIAIDWSSE